MLITMSIYVSTISVLYLIASRVGQLPEMKFFFWPFLYIKTGIPSLLIFSHTGSVSKSNSADLIISYKCSSSLLTKGGDPHNLQKYKTINTAVWDYP